VTWCDDKFCAAGGPPGTANVPISGLMLAEPTSMFELLKMMNRAQSALQENITRQLLVQTKCAQATIRKPIKMHEH
jgi:hypothetical protein